MNSSLPAFAIGASDRKSWRSIVEMTPDLLIEMIGDKFSLHVALFTNLYQYV